MGVDFPEYIRITSAEKPSYWYADKMGEVFKVTGDASEVGSGYWVHYQGFDDVHTVAKEDCEPITKHEGRYYREIKRKAREGELIKIVAPFEASDYSIGYIAQVYASSFDGIVFFKDTLGDPNSAYLHEYLVLEPIAPSQPHGNERIDDLAANLETFAQQTAKNSHEIGALAERLDMIDGWLEDADNTAKSAQRLGKSALSRIEAIEQRLEDVAEIAEPRGRLIDADALIAELRKHERMFSRKSDEYLDNGEYSKSKIYHERACGVSSAIGIIEIHTAKEARQ